MSRFEKFSNLIKPNPKFADPEDEENPESSAQLVERGEDDEVDEPITKKLIELGDVNPARYAGRRTSRKQLDDQDLDLELPGGTDEESVDDVSADESEVTDDDVSGSQDDDSQDDGDRDGVHTDAPNGEDMDDDMEETGDVEAFSHVDQVGELEKAAAIKAQSVIYSELLECRIKLQRPVQLSNRLPQPDVHNKFLSAGGPIYKEPLVAVQDKLVNLLNDLVHLQTLMLSSNPDTRFISTGEEFKESNSDEENEDEIPSSEDEEEMANKEDEEQPEVKRLKLDVEGATKLLAERHERFNKYRNASISKWNERTSVIKMADSSSFSSFETSVLAYIDKILSDEERLIRRTQLQRTSYHVLGKRDVQTSSGAPAIDEDVIEEEPKQRVHLQEQYDSEIFDDDDFYQHLLREMIERCTMETGGVNRRWLEIQQLRSSLKKKVDSSYNKDRKVKFIIHTPLLNFVAPVKKDTLSDQTKDELFGSLFGNLKTS